MYAIITGCGRLGTGVARALAEKGNDVVVVDVGADPGLVGDGFDGMVVDGSPIDGEVLTLAGVKKADLLVAATAHDSANILTAQLGTEFFKVPKAIARVSNPRLAAFYRAQGMATVCPTATGINQVLAAIQGEVFGPLAATIDPDVVAVLAPAFWVGTAMSKIDPGPGRRLVGLVSKANTRPWDAKRIVAEGDSLLLQKERQK